MSTLRTARKNVYGSMSTDPRRAAIDRWSSSGTAGAHIAAYIALDDHYVRDAGVDTAVIRGLIGLSGPYVVDPDHAISSRGICFANERCKRLMAQIFAEKQLTPDWQLASAATNNLGVLLIHGRDDALVPMQHSEFFCAIAC